MTPRPVHTVLHTPITMAFVERRLLGIAFMSGVMVLGMTGWFSLGIGTFLVGYAFALWTRDDPTLLTAILRATRTRTHYDAAAYQRQDVEIR